MLRSSENEAVRDRELPASSFSGCNNGYSKQPQGFIFLESKFRRTAYDVETLRLVSTEMCCGIQRKLLCRHVVTCSRHEEIFKIAFLRFTTVLPEARDKDRKKERRKARKTLGISCVTSKRFRVGCAVPLKNYASMHGQFDVFLPELPKLGSQGH